jgi:cell division protein FtsI (penicillin-binding protein 3)/stage V sporulation protein D (sporulation-specific penicillin-binding protein)
MADQGLEAADKKSEKINELVGKLSSDKDPYEPIAKKIEQEKAEEIRGLGLPGINYTLEDYRFYPENEISSHLTGFVGFSGNEKKGRYGLEGFFDRELSGKSGYIRGERDARGSIIAVTGMEWGEAEDGCDLVLTINRSIQYVACGKLKEAVLKHGAKGGSVVVIDPASGGIIAMCSYPDYDANNYQNVENIYIYNNPVIFSQYEPGSIFKPLTMAAAIDQGKVGPNTTYKDNGSIMIKGWNKPIKNSDFSTHGGHGVVNMNKVLELSLNTGAIFAMESIGSKSFSQYVQKFGFGEKTGIELETESPGDIGNLLKDKIKEIDAAVASFGQGLTATPLQMASSYAALANGGMLMKPYLVKSLSCGGGYSQEVTAKQIRRVISERTSALITGMLVKVVEEGHAKRAQIPGYYVAGKTGTAQVASKDGGYGDNYIHSFVGYTPAEDPKIVMLTKIDEPRDVEYAEGSAVPLFNEIAKFILQYYEIPTEREVK